MPYTRTEALPESVRNHLPPHAQKIYLATYNSAWDEYQHDEERAHRVAWAAVKRTYVKNEQTGYWEPSDSDHA